MAIWSHYDIAQALEKGKIEIDPKPEISTISVDLQVDRIFTTSPEQASELIKVPTKLHDPFQQGRIRSGVDSLELKPLQLVDGKYRLQLLHPYVIIYKERFKFDEDVDYYLTKRSRYARCGIAGFSQDINKDGYIYELVYPLANNVIYRGDKISQITLADSGTKQLSLLELEDIFDSGDLVIYDEKGFEILGGRINLEDSSINLTLHHKVKNFVGEEIDRKNFKPEDFLDADLSRYGEIHTCYFILGRTRERVKLSNKYAGIIPKADPIHDTTISYAPFIKPGSDGVIVLEIYPKDLYGIHHDMIIPLFIVPVKTPTKYEGRFKEQRDIMLPW
jgi:deoxycytidine triphosphate deaminase